MIYQSDYERQLRGYPPSPRPDNEALWFILFLILLMVGLSVGCTPIHEQLAKDAQKQYKIMLACTTDSDCEIKEELFHTLARAERYYKSRRPVGSIGEPSKAGCPVLHGFAYC